MKLIKPFSYFKSETFRCIDTMRLMEDRGIDSSKNLRSLVKLRLV